MKRDRTESERPVHLGSRVLSRWRAAMRQAGFFQAGDRVGVAVSGGADSILLLDFMVALGRELGFRLAVVHFNHCLRGSESDADERFVRDRASELGLDLVGGRADVARVARERKKNLEATARELRYRFFFSLVRKGRLDKVATAHTANDQAETVLLRLLRGAGTRGLGGIYPTLSGGVVRPFLSLTRAEVEDEVAVRGLASREDSSNRDTRFKRNYLRRAIMPLLERELNPRAVLALSAFADRSRDDEAFLEQQSRERSRPWIVHEAGSLKIPVQRLNEFPPAVARRVLRQMLSELPINDGGLTIDRKIDVRQFLKGPSPSYGDIESVRHLAREAQSGKRLLVGAIEVRKEFDWLVMSRLSGATRPPEAAGFTHEIKPPAEVSIPELDLLLRFRMTDKLDANLPQQEYTGLVWLDAVDSRGPLILRNFRPGDRVTLSAHDKPTKMKEIFQRRRVPWQQRSYWPVLELNGRIIWTRGWAVPVGFSGDSGLAGRKLLLIQEGPVSGWSRGKKH